VAHPGCRLGRLPLLGEGERRQLLGEWNRTEAPYPREACLHELFQRQAERTPEAVALVCEGQQLTYGELEQRANRLAHHLRSLGVGPEARVGVCLDRSAGLVVGLLAVLKAGGAYVPLDPGYPARRLHFMLQDSAARLLLTQRGLRDRLPDAALVVCVDEEEDALAAQSAEDPCSGVTSADLAYVLYTSGSTGRPKGVAVEHRSAAAFLSWARGAFGGEAGASVLASTSACFDLSVFELFGPLRWCWSAAPWPWPTGRRRPR